MRPDDKAFVDSLCALAHAEDPKTLHEVLDGVRPEDIAEAFQRMEVEDGLAILRQLDAERAAYVMLELPRETARAYIDELPDATVANYLDILPMDDAIDVREWLDPERFEALLKAIPKEDALEIRRLLSYPADSAGQLMTEGFFWVGPDETMAEVLQDIRESVEEYEMVNYIYVLDDDRHLLGVMSLRRLLRSAPTAVARDVMNRDVLMVPTDMNQEEVAREISHYGISAMPVLDQRGRMVGIITADDAAEILEDAETEDALKMGAVSGDAEPYLSLSVLELIKRRVPWLLALFIAESLTGNVLRYYGQGGAGDEVKLNPLAFFIPLLIGAGGNSGSQVTTTITRALALGEVLTSDWWRVMRRECVTALISGGILGLVGFGRAYLNIPIIGWGSKLDISLVVGIALPAIVLWSTTVGSLLPIGAKRLNIDPAVMSAPFISTFVDATGLIIYFEIAKRMIGHLS